MNAFDQAMNALDEKFSFLSSSKQIVSDMNEEEKVIKYTIIRMALVASFVLLLLLRVATLTFLYFLCD
jgi:1,4-alpha-glucan branching enzyme